MATTSLHAKNLWTPLGWNRNVRLLLDKGAVDAIEPADRAGGNECIERFVLPGMPNLHSHAFQRAMAGLAERRGDVTEGRDDNFWTWRETMYGFASRIGPDDLRAVAAQLYVEMLKAGYTQVCEFHYLHNAPDGRPYADPAAMSLALIEAAREAGIGLTLLPVLYMIGGFDGRPLSERQRRFGLDVETYLRLIDGLRALESPMLRVGIALHSLRAVPEHALQDVLAYCPLPSGEGAPPHESAKVTRANHPVSQIHEVGRVRVRPERDATGFPGPSPQPLSHWERGFIPIHIHIAEQIGEVEECLAARGARPVRWLLDHAEVDARWCLVHATHVDAEEIRGMAETGAVVGLCPTTEANLGDGLFPLADYLDAGGALGIGSDSQISVSPVEELRWLEYGQRLVARSRNVAARESGASVGETLWRAALQGGARASGLPAFGIGARTDLIVLDDASPSLAARDQRSVLDSFVFSGNAPLVKQVMVGGEWVVRAGRHHDEEAIAARYRAAVERLAAR